MGLIAKLGNAFNGDSAKQNQQQEWTESQANSSDNNFAMPDPNLKGMALGKTETIPTLEPIAKLNEVEVDLREKEARDWRQQEQLHGRKHAADTSIFTSHTKISESQFTHGRKRISTGLKSRDRGAVKFGQELFGEARPEFISQNLRVKLAKDAGDHTIRQLNQRYEQASSAYADYVEEM